MNAYPVLMPTIQKTTHAKLVHHLVLNALQLQLVNNAIPNIIWMELIPVKVI